MTITALAILAIAGGLLPLVRRDLKRAVARRRTIRVRFVLNTGEFVVAMREAQRAFEKIRSALAAAATIDGKGDR